MTSRRVSRDQGWGKALFLGLLCLAWAAAARAQLTDEEARTLEGHSLNMEKVVKVLRASKAIGELAKKDPAFARDLDATAHEPRLEQEVKRLEANKTVQDLLRPLGVTPKDFVYTLKALALARQASSMPPTLPHPGASAEHIRFFREHDDEIELLEEQDGSPPSPSPKPLPPPPSPKTGR
jgi:hypothetical protein